MSCHQTSSCLVTWMQIRPANLFFGHINGTWDLFLLPGWQEKMLCTPHVGFCRIRLQSNSNTGNLIRGSSICWFILVCFFVYVQADLRKETIFHVYWYSPKSARKAKKKPRAGATPGFQPRPAGEKGVKKSIEMATEAQPEANRHTLFNETIWFIYSFIFFFGINTENGLRNSFQPARPKRKGRVLTPHPSRQAFRARTRRKLKTTISTSDRCRFERYRDLQQKQIEKYGKIKNK